MGSSTGTSGPVHGPTPRTLGVCDWLGCSGFCVPFGFCCPFWWWFCGCRGVAAARVSRRGWRAVPRSAAPVGRVGSSFLTGVLAAGGLSCAGREHGDLGRACDGLLGGGGVREFRAGFLGAL